MLLPHEFDCAGVEKADPEGLVTAGWGVMDFYDPLLKTWLLQGKPASGPVTPASLGPPSLPHAHYGTHHVNRQSPELFHV